MGRPLVYRPTLRPLQLLALDALGGGGEYVGCTGRLPELARAVDYRATSLLEGREGEQMELNPGGIIAWIVVGLIAGWLADRFVKGGGFGLIGDLVVGLLGALIGGFLVGSLLQGSFGVGLFGSIVVAFIGAVILIYILRLVGGKRFGH